MEMRKVFKSGNSLAITIPWDAVQKLGLREGDFVYSNFQNSDSATNESNMTEKRKQAVLMCKAIKNSGMMRHLV